MNALGSVGRRTVTVVGRPFRLVELVVVATAVVGLGLALPSIGSPTSRLVLSDPGRGEVLSDQSWWSWGGSSAKNGGTFERVLADDVGLWFFVATLVVGLGAVILWLVRPTPAGCLVGVVGLTVPTTLLVGSVVQRVGSHRAQAYLDTGMTVRSPLQPAAVTETFAGVVLVLALAALTLGSAQRLGAWSAVEADAAGLVEPDGIRTADDEMTPAPGGPKLTGPVEEFRDDPPALAERPQRPDHRFEPPQ